MSPGPSAPPADDPGLEADFRQSFDALAGIGRNPRTGGYNRFAWTAEDASARDWFASQAAASGLVLERDRNGNLWAWWGPDREGAVVTGSHLDTVPEGGAFDGALGLVSGFVAIRELGRRRVKLLRPLAVVAFADEEGARYGVATMGSRLMVGALDPEDILARADAGGITLGEALRTAEIDAAGIGSEPERLARAACFLELHIEQGRALVDIPAPIGVATAIWPHGRWRLSLEGEPNHAGTTRLVDRRDPTLVLSEAIHSARRQALATGSLATVGRVLVEPNGTNSVAGQITAWLDARAPDDGTLEVLLEAWTRDVTAAAAEQGVAMDLGCESRVARVAFDDALNERLCGVLEARGLPAPRLPTGAGHDAGALSAVLPAAMLFVRNGTGVSHSPHEAAEVTDCLLGVRVLADALEELACR